VSLNKGIMKYVLVTGGVVSGLGKGVTASSIGVLLKNCGLRVTSIKIGVHHAARCRRSMTAVRISGSYRGYCIL